MSLVYMDTYKELHLTIFFRSKETENDIKGNINQVKYLDTQEVVNNSSTINKSSYQPIF